jgi:ubiquinone/menaquinone biosynthesis C-methylase UbiE
VVKWGQLNDNVSGIEATRYLESKGVNVLLNPSDFMAKTKLDFETASQKGGFRVPGNAANKFPKIVKYVDGLASIGMDYDSICYSEEAVAKRVELMKENEPTREVLVQDFIRGIESMVIVVEMGSEVYALAPVDWVFAPSTPVDKAWLAYGTKFESLAEGSVHFEFITDEPRRTNVCKAAVAAFKGLGMQGRGAWGRVDMRCEHVTGDVYCLELNHMPCLFYPEDSKLSDDIIIRDAYPGGHEAFIEMLLFTKKIQTDQGKAHYLDDINGHSEHETSGELIGDFKTKGKTIAEVYNNAADTYDNVASKLPVRSWQEKYFANYDYSGTILDLACGTGALGMIIHQANPTAQISGIDVSALSLQKPNVLEHYAQPATLGYMQDEIMKCGEKSFDHVVCYGALHFLDRTEFMAVVSRMFMVARKSIFFEVADVNQEYIDAILKCFGEGLRNHNNVSALRRFGTPKGWEKVVDEWTTSFFSPSVHTDVYGYMVRFEKQ